LLLLFRDFIYERNIYKKRKRKLYIISYISLLLFYFLISPSYLSFFVISLSFINQFIIKILISNHQIKTRHVAQFHSLKERKKVNKNKNKNSSSPSSSSSFPPQRVKKETGVVVCYTVVLFSLLQSKHSCVASLSFPFSGRPQRQISPSAS
jgi:cytoskeletal protein RodZ